MAGKASQRLPSREDLEAVIETLLEEGSVNEQQALRLQESLEAQLEDSAYVMKHFGVHLGIGVVFAFDVVPLPLGTISRVGWVAIARIGETLRGNHARARVHSLRVLLVAAIPWLGYVAYLVPLRRDHRELAFLLANHAWLDRGELSFEQAIRQRPPWMRRVARRFVPTPWQA